MSEYSFRAGDLVHYYRCSGDLGQPAVVVANEEYADGPYGAGCKDKYYRVQLADGTRVLAFFRNLFPRMPICDLDSRKIPLDVWAEIKLLDLANVRHRSGHRIGEVSEAFILEGAKAELVELQDAPDDIDEMADTMAILIHYCVRKGWTREQVDRAIMEKLHRRVGPDAEPKEERKGLGPVNYDGLPPGGYRCGECGASGVRLWREYQTFLDHQTLRCLKCAMKDQGKTVDKLRQNGLCRPGENIDSIGWLILAVPTEDGETYWGYCAVPDNALKWWHKLPLE